MTQISLKDFRDAVEARLAACSIDDLRAILRSMAEATTIDGREDFLKDLGATVPMDMASDELLGKVRTMLASLAPKPSTVPAGVAAPILLDKVTVLVDDYEEAIANCPEPEGEDDWYGSGDEEDPVYEEFVPRFVNLFDLAAAAYDYGDFDTAVKAYEILFEGTGMSDEYDRGVQVDLSQRMDLKAAITRYLRAVYQTEPLEKRAAEVLSAMAFVEGAGFQFQVDLDNLAQLSPGPLPDWERFLADYIVCVRAAPISIRSDSLLRNAVHWARGDEGLAVLAREEGLDHSLAYLDWFEGLQRVEKWSELLPAAQDALRRLPVNWSIRAKIADYLCKAARQLDMGDVLRWGYWEAFTVEPRLERLLDLWDSALPEPERTALMQRAQGYLTDYKPLEKSPLPWQAQPCYISPSLLAHAALLAGDWKGAYEIAAKEQVLGWSSSNSASALVMGALLVFLSGQGSGTLSESLGAFWREALSDFLYDDKTQRKHAIYGERFADVTMPAAQQEAFLAACLETVERRVQAIVGGQHRKSYAKAAQLTRACIEVLTFRQGAAAGKAFELKIREQFPRHSAFQAEFKTPLGKVR